MAKWAIRRTAEATEISSRSMDGTPLTRLGLVVHPRRELDMALDNLRRWSDARGVDARPGAGRRARTGRGRAAAIRPTAT